MESFKKGPETTKKSGQVSRTVVSLPEAVAELDSCVNCKGPETTKKSGQVSRTVVSLEKAVAELDSCVNCLDTRLIPVLLPNRPTAGLSGCLDTAEEKALTPLTEKLENILDSILLMKCKVENILNNLEL